MLKLTLNSRKRSKRNRSILHRLRLPNSMDLDKEDQEAIQKEAAADNLRALVMQENSGKYTCSDYLKITSWQPNAFQLMKRTELETRTGPASTRIDEYCREQIVEWSFRVVDYFRIDREVVTISLSFLDRFLGCCKCSRSEFKLAATTTLHLAVKLLYPCKLIDLGILSDLSRGEFDMSDVSEMESQILHSLKWQLHPPTSSAFSSIFLDFFLTSRVCTLAAGDLDDIYDVSSFFCELAVCDYFFVTKRASTIGLAAILNTLEGMFGAENATATDILHAARVLDLGLEQDLSAARNRLWELYERSEECALHNDKSADEDMYHGGSIFIKKSTSLSPVSVSKSRHSHQHSASEFVISANTNHHTVRNESW
jgi:hypothetical protein